MGLAHEFERSKMAEEKLHDNTECKSDSHNKHLCYMVSQGFHVSEGDEFEALVKNPAYKCSHCGRVANSDNNLCVPVGL